jgi:hypothetical protein
MAQSPDPLDLLVAAVPSLRAWRDQADDYRNVPSVHYSMLAEELVRQAQDGSLPTLPLIAPVIEELLRSSDEDDAVSIGFIETLQAQVEEHRLDSSRVHEALGPIARQQWESLYHYRHQMHLCEIAFDKRHIAGPLIAPAHFQRWLVKRGARVPRGTSLARILTNDEAYELQVDFGCYIDRFATSDGDALREGALLLYVLPDTDAHVKPPAPYCVLKRVGPLDNAAA